MRTKFIWLALLCGYAALYALHKGDVSLDGLAQQSVSVFNELIGSAPAQTNVRGSATVIDGDTLDIAAKSRSVRVRLLGIDACEKQQHAYKNNIIWPCGIEATRKMAARVSGQIEETARKKRLGLWAYDFQKPAEWRREN